MVVEVEGQGWEMRVGGGSVRFQEPTSFSVSSFCLVFVGQI